MAPARNLKYCAAQWELTFNTKSRVGGEPHAVNFRGLKSESASTFKENLSRVGQFPKSVLFNYDQLCKGVL